MTDKDTGIADEEIDEDLRKMHAEAEKKVAELKEKEKAEFVSVPEKVREKPQTTASVLKPKIRTFDQWFNGENMGKELETLSHRRGQLVGLMTAYTNLDISRGLTEIAKTLKEIPDLIQDVVDSVDAVAKKLDDFSKSYKSEDKKPVSAVRKRGGITADKED
uniref:Uncharacterized protein n=1 Tax=viral metagenome TaxID=1070528 RepID=A0A6M3LEX8_9ZZZZ